MKILIVTLSAFVAFAVNVLTTPCTWADTINLATEVDSFFSYVLKLNLNDDGGNKGLGKPAVFDNSGIVGDGFYNFNLSNQRSFGMSLADLIQRTETDKNVISVSSADNDILHHSSKLTGYGKDAAPVPESGTMVLLGFGLLGFAIYGKRRINKES